MYIHVRAKPDSKEEKITKEDDTHYIISVREKAERNMANKTILAIIRNLYPKKTVRMVSGHHSPSKILAVD